MYKVNIYSFTENGKALAKKVSQINVKNFRGEKLEFNLASTNNIDADLYSSFDAHIFVGATGIAIRKVAPFLDNKYNDPAVVVIDEKGEFVIPVLSGHLGGANSLSKIVAKEISAKEVITTATDVNGYNALDKIVSESRVQLNPPDCIRSINSKILKGDKIRVYVSDDIDVIHDTTGVYEVGDKDKSDAYIVSKSNYIIGIGCRKNIDPEIFERTLDEILSAYNIDYINIDRIASIDLKKNENAIIEYTKKNKIMYETYSSEELNSVKGDFDESDFVKEITGVANVSERACVYAGSLMGTGDFILKREAKNGITISIYKVRKRINLNGKS